MGTTAVAAAPTYATTAVAAPTYATTAAYAAPTYTTGFAGGMVVEEVVTETNAGRLLAQLAAQRDAQFSADWARPGVPAVNTVLAAPEYYGGEVITSGGFVETFAPMTTTFGGSVLNAPTVINGGYIAGSTVMAAPTVYESAIVAPTTFGTA